MAAVLLSPIGNGQQFFNDNGTPLAGGLIYTYQAGSSSPLATFVDNGGTVANSNPIVLDSAGRLPAEVWLFTGYSYKFIIKTAADVLIQSLDNIYPILQNNTAVGDTIPAGLIAIWSGSTGSVPTGWALCDGTGGTPDLRNSLFLGAGSTYAVGDTGGTADAIVVSHTHTATVTDPTHTHSAASGNFLVTTGSHAFGGGSNVFGNVGSTAAASTGISVSNATAGVSGTNANLPPYYALAYIIKL